MAALKRQYGGIQPYIPAGIFRIRLPFLHFKISPPEIVTGLMNACTSYGALAVLTGTMGLSAEVAWGLVVFETAMYTCNWLLGEPSICGWITPAMAIVVVYLESYDPGIQRIQAMTAAELELAVLFFVLGFSGTAKKLNTLVPPAVKAGIVLGAGISAVSARMKTGGAFDTQTWGCAAGLVVVFFLMFSLRIRKKMENSTFLNILGNYSFLWAIIAMFAVGGIAGEFNFAGVGSQGILKAPDWNGMFNEVSPFYIGWAPMSIWLNSIPIALISWVIAYGDFITVRQLGLNAMRDDEFIELDPNRTNVICGLRNTLLALFAPYPAQAGPLSAPYCVATYQRYKVDGRKGMDSIYDGSGTNLIFTVCGLFVYPLYQMASAAAGAMLVVVLLIQGYVCTQICFDLAFDKTDEGVAGMMAGFIIARGGAWGLIAGLILYFMLADNEKIKDDYAGNKERQRIEDETTNKLLAEAIARREAFKNGTLKPEDDEGGKE